MTAGRDAGAFVVGITGHRPNRLRIGPAALERQCLDAMAAVVRGTRGCRHVAVSALAEGADRAFAHAALMARYELHGVLPFASADYVTTFADPGALADYKKLLAAAARVDELPGQLDATAEAYAAAGRELVARSHIILAVWDGEGREGEGGTPEVIAMALAAARPVIWIDAHGIRPRRLLAASPAERGLPLDILKKRWRKLKPRRTAMLAARLAAGVPAIGTPAG